MIKFLLFLLLPIYGFAQDDIPVSRGGDFSSLPKQEFVSIEKFKDWEVFKLEKGEEVICWITTSAIFKDDSKATLSTTIRPLKNIRDEISFYSEKNLSSNKNVYAIVDKQGTFTMSPHGKWAWLTSDIDQSRFAVASRNGNKVEIKFYDENDQLQHKKFSLSGYSAAHKSAIKHCTPFFKIKNSSNI